MGLQRGSAAVRPLVDAPPRVRERGAPRAFLLAVALLGGLTTGWLLAVLGGGGSDIVDEPTAVSAVTSLSAEPESVRPFSVRWTGASEIPAIPRNWEVADHSGFAEVGGTKYFVVQLRSPGNTETVSEVWSSDDGLVWSAQRPDFGKPITDPRLTAAGDGLFLVGNTGSDDVLWRATQVATEPVLDWEVVPLHAPAGMSNQVISTAVAGDGDIIVTMHGSIDIWPNDELNTRLLCEDPQVVVVDHTAWIRIVTCEGEELMRTVPLPQDTRPVAANFRSTDLELYAAWVSSNGGPFLPVGGDDRLPPGCFSPTGWSDGFVAAAEDTDDSGTVSSVLWTSASGDDWRPDPVQPPAECSPFSLVASGEAIHVTSADGTQCSRGPDSDWVVLDEARSSCYKIGGQAGFVGYPNGFDYDRGLLSRDGVLWNEIPVPGMEPYPTLAILEDSLLALSVLDDPDPNRQIRIWLGTIGSA